MAYTNIKKSSDYFNTKLYTGNDSTNAITGVGHQPDLIWVKSRSAASHSNLIDSVRGVKKHVSSSSTNAEDTEGASNGLSSFDSDGFTWSGRNTGTGTVNENSTTYVGWSWSADGTGVANTDGSISSTVSANTTSGFSIVSYTGTGSVATVGHGLGVAPSMIIVKRRSGDAGDWRCYHKSLGEDYLIRLNLTNASLDNPSWNDTAPTSSVFSIGTNGDVNTSGGNHIAYCFADVQGFSKFESYVGNGSADGTFVYTGFKPAFVMIKRTNSTGNWLMFDSKRDGFNSQNDNLYANTTTAEQSDGALDIFSNGFKCTVTGTDTNGSGSTYIYMAFASEPLVGDNPATAR